MPQLSRSVVVMLAVMMAGGQTGGHLVGGAGESLARFRNLGKAFFENPTTQAQAVEQFRLAVAAAGATVEDRVNLGIALLAAGKTSEGVAELERAQKLDGKIPHTWFNLGIQYKKAGEYEKAQRQLEQMARLVPDEPVTRYNLGTLHKMAGRVAEARREFELAAKLAPQLAAPHFQLFNLLRQAGEMEEARQRLALFQKAKKDAEASPVPEDMEWSFYSEVIDERPEAPPPAAPEPLTEARGDFNNDGLQDKVVFRAGKPVLMRAVGKGFAEEKLSAPEGTYRAAVWLDFDHDYDLDLVLLGDRCALMRNRMEQGFEDASTEFPFVAGKARSGVAFRYVADTRGMDLLVHYEGRASVLYRDRLAGRYEATAAPKFAAATAETKPAGGGWVTVRLIGVKNLKLAEGAEVEVKAGSFYHKRIYRGEPLRFDVPVVKTLDAVRITWPNGLIQSEARQPVNRALVFKEAQRLSGSCPTVWTWNGRGVQYITDVLGVAPLGAAAGGGEYFPTDHEEAVVLPEGSLEEREGRYEVRITEELAEVTYLDRVRLLAVDHARGTQLVSNEKFQSPPYPAMKLAVARGLVPLRMRGGGLEAEMDWPEAAARWKQPVLVMTGWVDWADGSTFLGLAQRGKALTLPKLEAQTADGRWHTVYEEMGMPAGKPKTIAVELAGRLPAGTRRLRVSSNLALHWTAAAVAESAAEVVGRELRLAETELRFRGFSRATIHPERKEPEMFHYARPLAESMWNPTAGMYTRYGSLDDLLHAADDRLVIMGSGDEAVLRFDGASLPRLGVGMTRSFVLVVEGWAKDQDANTAHSQTVEPLPFRGMTGYPYGAGERFPNSEGHLRWREAYNTRPALRPLRALARGGRVTE
ncbi:MAG: tetratricopeptide repeat protein [Acidobacteria bacterium]|nr:tetratricopeptide repeat protein [Acidobacteriota bacterium]